MKPWQEPCPACGGPKSKVCPSGKPVQFCADCRRHWAAKPSTGTRVCPKCGGPKNLQAQQCRACFAREVAAQELPPHGTAGRYKRGCRCDECRAWSAQQRRDYRYRHLARERAYWNEYYHDVQAERRKAKRRQFAA